MKITTRISLSYGILIAVLVILAACQLYAIHRIQSLNRAVAGIDFQNMAVCLQAMRDLDLVEEHARKSFELTDRNYLRLLQDYQKDFTNSISLLKNRAHSEEERAAMQRLAVQWDVFTERLGKLEKQWPPGGAALPDILQEDLQSLKVEIHSVYQANLAAMASKVEKSGKTGETATLVLWVATTAVLIVSILASFLIYRSISRPLAHLTEGTRAIAEGQFFYRLDATRDDEFSLLARDINSITRRLDELDRLKKD